MKIMIFKKRVTYDKKQDDKCKYEKLDKYEEQGEGIQCKEQSYNKKYEEQCNDSENEEGDLGDELGDTDGCELSDDTEYEGLGDMFFMNKMLMA